MAIEVESYFISKEDYTLLREQHVSEYLKIDPDYTLIMGEQIEFFLSADEIADVENYLDILHLND